MPPRSSLNCCVLNVCQRASSQGTPDQRSSATPTVKPAPTAAIITVSLLQPALVERRAQRERDRSGGGVAVALDVLHHLGVGQAQPLLGGVDDADIGLVGDEEVEPLG